MRAEAAARASPFVDPKLLRDAAAVLPGVPGDWLAWVVGRPVASYRSLTNAELALAVRAAAEDAAHLAALAAERRAARHRAEQATTAAAADAAQAQQDQWAALRARLPVPVSVQHNWTARHLDRYEQGADHIVVAENLHIGRFRRSAGDPLCWTPSRAHQLRHVSGNAGDELRLPDCKACLGHAERLARPARTTQRDPERYGSIPAGAALSGQSVQPARRRTPNPSPAHGTPGPAFQAEAGQ
jgi:hypothetical protein